MKWFLLVLIGIISMMGATRPEPKIVYISDDDFPVEELEGRVINWLNDHVSLPRSVALKGEYLIVIENDFQVNTELFKLFSLAEEEMVGYYGKSGRGPGEIQGGIQKIPIYGIDSRFSFLDYTRNRISVIDIDDVLDGNHDKEPDQYKVLPPDFIQLQYGTLVNDTLVTGGGSIREGKLFFGNYQTNEYKFTKFIPETEKEVATIFRQNIFMHQIAINANKKKVVVSNNYFNQIEIYNYQGNLELIITGDFSDQVFDTQSSGWISPNTITYYSNVITTDNYIMAIFYNKKSSDLRDEEDFFKEGVQSAIRVFDWKGNPVKEYTLDRRVSRIAYDEDRNRIIALHPDALESLVEYDVNL